MIIAFVGKMGSGKTLSMTKFVYDYYKRGCSIYANYGLKIPYEQVDYEKIKNLSEDFQNSVLCLDEIHVFIDSRASASDINKRVSYFITQSRKRNLVLMYTTQKFNQVEKRLRENTDYMVECSKTVKNGKMYIRCNMTDTDGKSKKFTIDAADIFKLYDTHEVVNPFE